MPREWRSGAAPDQEHALLIMHVTPDSPAKQTGINLGDVIVSADGKPVQRVHHLHQLLSLKRTGEALRLQIVRGGNFTECEVTLGDRQRP